MGEFLEPQPDTNSENYMFALDTLKYIHSIVMWLQPRTTLSISADFWMEYAT